MIITVYNLTRTRNVFTIDITSDQVQLKGILTYATAESIKDQIDAYLKKRNVSDCLEFDMCYVLSIDYDILVMFQEVSLELSFIDVQLKFVNVTDGGVKKMLTAEGLFVKEKDVKSLDEIYDVYTSEVYESNV